MAWEQDTWARYEARRSQDEQPPPAAGQHGLSLAGGMTRCAVPDAAAPGTVSPGLNGQVISMGLGRPGA